MRNFIINYKAYREGFENGERIAKFARTASKKLGIRIIIAPPFTLLKELSKICETVAQGIDQIDPGAFTGHISWYEIKNSGALGSIINHSENKLSLDQIKESIEICKKNSLLSFVCASNIAEAREIMQFKPYAIAYEPPELIGGDISVSKAKPKVVKDFIELIRKGSEALPLIGAGIKTAEDVKKGVELGSEGVLVASGVIKAEDYEKTILELGKPLSG